MGFQERLGDFLVCSIHRKEWDRLPELILEAQDISSWSTPLLEISRQTCYNFSIDLQVKGPIPTHLIQEIVNIDRDFSAIVRASFFEVKR